MPAPAPAKAAPAAPEVPDVVTAHGDGTKYGHYVDEELTRYDASEYYDDEIAPLVRQILIRCRTTKGHPVVPCFMTFALKNGPEGTKYKNEGVLTGSTGIRLQEDMFQKILLVINGARVTILGGIESGSSESDYMSEAMKEMETEDAGMEEDEDRKEIGRLEAEAEELKKELKDRDDMISRLTSAMKDAAECLSAAAGCDTADDGAGDEAEPAAGEAEAWKGSAPAAKDVARPDASHEKPCESGAPAGMDNGGAGCNISVIGDLD